MDPTRSVVVVADRHASRRRRHRFGRAFTFGALSALALLCACGRKELSERPPRSGDAASFETGTSTIAAEVTIPIATLSGFVSEKLPKTFETSGNGPDICVKINLLIAKKKICAGTKYDLAAVRTGDVTIEPAGPRSLRFALPISFSGHGGFRGSVAKAIKADKKAFKGSLIVNADLVPKLDPDWCPRLDPALSYQWTSDPKVEIVSGVWVNVKHEIEAKLDDKLPDLADKAGKAIDCGKFRARLAALYGSKTFPVDVPLLGKVHVNLEPLDIAFSGISVGSAEIAAAALLTAKVEIAETALAPAAIPLPPLKAIAPVAPRTTISVPLRLPYETLGAALSKTLAGRDFAQDTPAGKVTVRVKSVEIYPSNGRLAIGLAIDATTPGSLFDTKGEVYLLARPAVEDGTRLVLSEIGYAQTLDSAFWAAAAVVFEGPIDAELAKHANYDFSADLDKAKAALTRKLTDPAAVHGWKIALSDTALKVGRLAALDQDLSVEGLFSAAMSIAPN